MTNKRSEIAQWENWPDSEDQPEFDPRNKSSIKGIGDDNGDIDVGEDYLLLSPIWLLEGISLWTSPILLYSTWGTSGGRERFGRCRDECRPVANHRRSGVKQSLFR